MGEIYIERYLVDAGQLNGEAVSTEGHMFQRCGCVEINGLRSNWAGIVRVDCRAVVCATIRWGHARASGAGGSDHGSERRGSSFHSFAILVIPW